MADKQFIIRLNGLPIGNHLYEFKVTDSFFETREYSDIHGANVDVAVELIKQNSVINLIFTITGTLQVLCDRCTKSYDVPIESVEKMHLRFGDPDEAHAEDVFVLPHGENELDISPPLFEFITLALPARLVPCEDDESFECDYETLNKLKNISVEEPEPKPEDSVWNKLKNINFNNN